MLLHHSVVPIIVWGWTINYYFPMRQNWIGESVIKRILNSNLAALAVFTNTLAAEDNK